MKPLLDELRSVAGYRKKTVAQVALNWNLQKGFQNYHNVVLIILFHGAPGFLVLVGIRSIEQVLLIQVSAYLMYEL